MSCSSSETRSNRDESIGRLTTNTFQLTAQNGLLHIVEHEDQRVTLRASASQFSIQLKRFDESLSEISLHILNIPHTTKLQAQAGALSDNAGDETLVAGTRIFEEEKLGLRWNVKFPQGVNEVTISNPQPKTESFKFLAFGDIQNGIDDFDDVVEKINQELNIDFVMLLGDITNTSTTKEFEKASEKLAKIKFPLYTAPGNHDVMLSSRYQDRYGRANYSFVHRSVRFTALDTSAFTLEKTAWDKYKSWLEEGKNQQHIVYAHIAPTETLGIRNGQWRSRREANQFIAYSSEFGVDTMFFGHLHTYDKYKLAGIPVYISGGAGAFEEKLDGIERHFLRVKVNPAENTTDVEVIKVD